MSKDLADLFFDVGAYFSDGIPEPPAPDIGMCSDGTGLFYRGKVNSLFGDPESMKTWVALAAAAQTLNDGGRVAVLDFDLNSADGILPRLIQLGVIPEVLADKARFLYVEIEDRDQMKRVFDALVEWQPGVAVIDSIGEVLPLFGASSNSPDDFTRVNRETAHRLAKAGAAVITIDHLAKNSESRDYGSTGTAAKKRAISGTYLRVKVEQPPAPGRDGSCLVTVVKDRPGGLRAHRGTDDKEPIAARFHLYADDPQKFEFKAPEGCERNPGEVPTAEDQARIMALKEWPVTVKRAREILGGRNDRVAQMVKWRKAQDKADTTLPGNDGERGNDSVTHYPPPMSVTGNEPQFTPDQLGLVVGTHPVYGPVRFTKIGLVPAETSLHAAWRTAGEPDLAADIGGVAA